MDLATYSPKGMQALAVLESIPEQQFQEGKYRFSRVMGELALSKPADLTFAMCISKGILYAQTPDYAVFYIDKWKDTYFKGLDKFLPGAGEDAEIFDVFIRICTKEI